MSASYATFIIAHENLASSLIQTVENILGRQESVYAYSNKHDSLPLLGQKIKDRIHNLQVNHIVFFTDLKGGSCWALSNMLRVEFPHIALISGVNLPMLVTYFNNLNEVSFNELISKVLDDGCRGITSIQG
jgi:PTS system mannose-specific IIA component